MNLDKVAYALNLLSSLPALIQSGADVLGIIEAGNQKLRQFQDENRDPSDAEWDELNESIAAKRRELHS